MSRGLRWVAVVFAALGTAVSAYLTWVHYAGSLALCVGFGGCEAVQTSRFATIGNVPVAVVGLAGFALMLALALLRLVRRDPALDLVLFGCALAATLYVAYLTYLELFVLGAVCPWCVATALCAIAVFAATAREVLSSPPA